MCDKIQTLPAGLSEMEGLTAVLKTRGALHYSAVPAELTPARLPKVRTLLPYTPFRHCLLST